MSICVARIILNFFRNNQQGFFTFNRKSNGPFRPRFTCNFQIVHVICQIHLPYTGYFCSERLLCKSSNENRSEICIREQFVTRMVRYGGENENCDFDKVKDANVGLDRKTVVHEHY